MSDMTLMQVLRDMNASCTAHGFSSSFREWVCESISFGGDLAEAALAHAIGNNTKPHIGEAICSTSDGGSWMRGEPTATGPSVW